MVYAVRAAVGATVKLVRGELVDVGTTAVHATLKRALGELMGGGTPANGRVKRDRCELMGRGIAVDATLETTLWPNCRRRYRPALPPFMQVK